MLCFIEFIFRTFLYQLPDSGHDRKGVFDQDEFFQGDYRRNQTYGEQGTGQRNQQLQPPDLTGKQACNRVDVTH